ncbi:putative ABC transport system permease protein [Saccharicrinis carchari]|uniref:Putative ABC transport system permease protein n=1 Tax=Saccharicrinis carchari TaxID=1168039 RepID=A0A521CN88_SACCC|nr:ABC transporter permease [Saccharicrinis carchari]SMO60858.1 putative ABC transport system permease protein [Saccharicrinis carchari]
MLKYYIKIALRDQAKNKLFSLINIIGLSVGLAVSVVIINYVSFEFSFDKMHQKKDRIYRVESQFYNGNQLTDNWGTSSFGYGSAISKEITGVEDFVRIGVHNTEQVVSYQEKRSRETGIGYADPSFFTIFDYKLKEGAYNDQLKRPNTVVITEAVAKQFFTNENPIGKLLTFATGTSFSDFEVTGILEDFPPNSHIRFNYLISYETLPQWLREFWYMHEAYTYLLLAPGKNPKEVEAQFPALAEKYKTADALKSKKWAITLTPLGKIYLNPQKQYEKEIKGNRKSLITLIIIAIVILLTAWINYINLTTARAMERAKDVGVRKVVGAYRYQLIIQYLIESLLVNLIAIAAAIILVFTLKPVFDHMLGENIGLYILDEPKFWISAIVIMVFGILLSGFYPAFIMTRVKPSIILKRNYVNSGSAGITRRVLVVFQFAASLFLICGTFIIYQQVKFMQEQDLGVDINQTIILKYPVSRSDLKNKVDMLAEKLQMEKRISSVTIAGAVPGMEIATFASNQIQGKGADQRSLFEMLPVDDRFIETFDIKILAGRTFQKGFGNEREKMLVNEAALSTLGIPDAATAIGKKVMLEGESDPVTIIGVVKNWHQRGLSNPYTPVMFIQNDRLGWVGPRYIAIKVASTDYDAILQQIKRSWDSYFPEASFDYFFLDSFFDAQYKNDNRFGRIVGVFTALAFFISGLGLWALAAFTASKKTKEVGIRKVLGAQSGNIIYLFSKEIIRLILIALLIATPISFMVMKNWLQNYAFSTNISLWVYLAGGAATLSVAMLTVLWHSWRAATRNPVEALRYE